MAWIDMEFTVYATGCFLPDLETPVQLAQRWEKINPEPNWQYQVHLTPTGGWAADFHQLWLDNFEIAPEDGWITCRASYSYNHAHCGTVKPLAFYVGEPTDWPSGLVRFHLPLSYDHQGKDDQGPVFTIAVRRAG